MIYRMIGDREMHLNARLIPLSPEKAQDALLDDIEYAGEFQANEFNRDDFYFMDMIESYGPPVFSQKFKTLCERQNVAARFTSVNIFWGGENILDWIGPEISGYFTAVLPKVNVIDDRLSPMRFWPKLKKFKHEDYVVNKHLPDGVSLAVDLLRPHLTLCSKEFRSACENAGFQVSFEDLPCVLGI